MTIARNPSEILETEISRKDQSLAFFHSGKMAGSGKRALVPIADGTEDLEVVSIVDVLRRAGVETVVAGVSGSSLITGARGVKIQPDVALSDASVAETAWDAIVLAGGMPGASHFHQSGLLGELLSKQSDAGRIVAAICASPAIVLVPLGLLDAVEATCFPLMKDRIPHFVNQRVKTSGHIITSQGPGTAVEFALVISSALVGQEAAAKVANGLLVSWP